MAATWTVSTMERTLTQGDLNDVITTLHWQVRDSETVGDVTHSGRCYGTVGLAAPDEDMFVAYEDLTEVDVIAWAKVALGPEQVAAYETSVANQIEMSKNPVSALGVPWS